MDRQKSAEGIVGRSIRLKARTCNMEQEAWFSMANQDTDRSAGMPDTTPEGSGQYPREDGAGVSVAAMSWDHFRSMTMHKQARLKVAPRSVQRLKAKLRGEFRRGRGRNLGRFITEDLRPLLKGWINYFRLAEVKGVFEELDGWLRRKLRNILWRQWKRSKTRAGKLMQRGLDEVRAWTSATNRRGPWWNSGASHMNQAVPKGFFDRLGLVNLLNELRRLQYVS